MSEALHIRPATPDDLALVLAFIRELADYERLTHELRVTPESLYAGLFGEQPTAESLLAFVGDAPAGFALYYFTFSTFAGQPGLYLEDLFVRPAHRGAGVGKALLAALAERARARGCAHMEWIALDWNEPALAFYRRLGAEARPEWVLHRLRGDALERLAAGEEPGKDTEDTPYADD